LKTLYSVSDADGAPFRLVDEQEAIILLEQGAAIIDGKRRKPKFKLVVDLSAARSLLAPRFQLSQGSRTVIKEYIHDGRFIYQHDSNRCAGFGVTG